MTASPCQTDLTVSVVNHNNRDMLDACLESVYRTTKGLDFEVVVVDNASPDGSAEMVRSKYPLASLIANNAPEGFASNHNKALRTARGEFIALLNNDTLVHPGAFEAMVSFMRAHPGAGLCGPRLLNSDGSLQESCYRTPTLGVLFFDAFLISSVFPSNPVTGGFKKWAHDSVLEAQSLSGACLLARREAVESAGPLDEGFFMYFEDHDWCLRMRRAGWKVFFVPDAVVTHHGAGSEGMPGHDRFSRFYSSMDRFYCKHYGPATVPLVAFLNIAGSLLRIGAWSAASPLSAWARSSLRERAPYFRRRISWYLSKTP